MDPGGGSGHVASGSSLAEAIFEASADGIVLVDEDGVILTANAAAERLLAREEGTLVGETLGVPSARVDPPRGAEIQIVRPDGGIRTVELRSARTSWEGRSVTVVTLRDVTDRLRTLEELRESVERLEEARRVLFQTVSSLDEAVLIVDSSGGGRTITDVNPAAEAIFGYDRDEMIGRSTELLHRDREAFEAFGRECGRELREHGVFRASYPVRRRDGTLFEAEQTVSLLDPEEGLAGGAVSVLRDVSERRQAEQELRSSEERFREIAEHIDDVFWVSSPHKGRITYVSPAYAEVWGRDPSELYEDAASWLETILPSDRERVRASLDGQHLGGWEQQYRIVRPDGEVRWIWDRAFPVRGPSGEVERIVGVAEDVSERKRAEERFGVLSQEITDIIFVVGADGVIRSASPSARELGGFSQEDVEGRDALSWVYPEDRDAVREMLDEIATEEGSVARVTHRVVTVDGEVRHMESVARNRLHHPAIAGIIFTSRDITERLRLEDQLRQSQKMEAVGRLAGGIAHDFNNLLTVIRSQTDLLLMDIEPSSPLRDEVKGIQASADRAARLTSQLLAFSRDQVLRPRVVNLSDVVRGMGELLARIIGEDIRIVQELPGELPSVRIDPTQLEQVVLNLAVNARDAMPDGGTLTLSMELDEVDEEDVDALPGVPPGEYVVLRVTDTGIGMDGATTQRIFEPFFSTKGPGKGTGLGLSMAYGFVKQSGGAIHADSTPGEGTTMALRFPVVEGRPEPDPEAPPPKEGFDPIDVSGVVLVVEDDPDVRRVTARVLERAGMRVEVASDAEAGLEALRRSRPVSLLLTDLLLPGMSGRALLDSVRETTPELPVVVMSGYAEHSPGERGDLPEEVAFIQKPFTPDALVEAVRTALREA